MCETILNRYNRFNFASIDIYLKGNSVFAVDGVTHLWNRSITKEKDGWKCRVFHHLQISMKEVYHTDICQSNICSTNIYHTNIAEATKCNSSSCHIKKCIRIYVIYFIAGINIFLIICQQVCVSTDVFVLGEIGMCGCVASFYCIIPSKIY